MEFLEYRKYWSSLKSIDIGASFSTVLYINDIPNSVNCTTHLFADDTCLLVGAPSINILENQLKDELNNIYNWISVNNLALNSKKLQIIIIFPNLKSSNFVLNI